jgi:hypothetical protein
MNEYRNVLERDLARVGPAPFDFDDVERRRDRKRRNQRIAAGRRFSPWRRPGT